MRLRRKRQDEQRFSREGVEARRRRASTPEPSRARAVFTSVSG